jgi:hypothetical protein
VRRNAHRGTPAADGEARVEGQKPSARGSCFVAPSELRERCREPSVRNAETRASSGLSRIARSAHSIARTASPPYATGAQPNEYAKAQDALSANACSNASSASLLGAAGFFEKSVTTFLQRSTQSAPGDLPPPIPRRILTKLRCEAINQVPNFGGQIP